MLPWVARVIYDPQRASKRPRRLPGEQKRECGTSIMIVIDREQSLTSGGRIEIPMWKLPVPYGNKIRILYQKVSGLAVPDFQTHKSKTRHG